MSLLNAWVEPGRAVIATDTATDSQAGTRGQMSKMLALPHLGAVVATIGNTDLCVVFMYTLTHLEGDFDRFLADADALVNDSASFYEARMGAGMRDGQAVAIVGWSRARGRAVGVYGERAKRGERFNVREIEGALVCPGWPEFVPGDALDSDAAMLDASRMQVAHVNRIEPSCPIGGRLLAAEVTRDGISFRTMGDL